MQFLTQLSELKDAKIIEENPNNYEDTWWTTSEGIEYGMIGMLKIPSRRNKISSTMSPIFGVCDVSNNATIYGKCTFHSSETKREQLTHWTESIFEEVGGGGERKQVSGTTLDDWSTHRFKWPDLSSGLWSILNAWEVGLVNGTTCSMGAKWENSYNYDAWSTLSITTSSLLWKSLISIDKRWTQLSFLSHYE